ncbi:MAG: DUF4345 domain-containing protein [Vicinamibacterales bacterium]
MTAWRLVLVIIGMSFFGFGAAFLAYPGDMASVVSIALVNASARTDVRAVYGGMELGIGVFFLTCAMRRDFVRVGLFAAACVLVAMATSRFVGLLLDGFWQPLQLFVMLLEAGGGFVATWGALVAKPAGTIPPPLPSSDSAHLETSSPRS